jgi:hypothetical protein
MHTFIPLAMLITLIFAQPNLIVNAQGRAWQTFSSPADDFTVEVPAGLRIVKTCEGRNEADLEPARREDLTSYTSCYEAPEASPGESRFRLLVINGRAQVLSSLPRAELLAYLSVMTIGDDDDPEPTSEAAVKVHGLSGTEYYYAKESKVFEHVRTNEIFKRGRVFDTGSKIYIQVFEGRDAKDLKSPDAERFFSSFRLGK